MNSVALCAASFLVCFAAGRRSLVAGLAALVGVGYSYGIVRANIPEPASHFLFDAGVLGLYAALWLRPLDALQRYRIRSLLPWVVSLAAWPVILFFVPFQDPLIQLLGLRGQALFLPFLIIGALLEGEDIYALALRVAMFNLVAFGFAGAEWLLGVHRFFPRNAVTELIYRSNDVFGQTRRLRIPATFVNSASYAAAMVVTMPLLVGAWTERRRVHWQRYLIMGAIVGSALSVFLAASRTYAAILIGLAAALVLFGHLKGGSRLVWIMIIAVVAWIVSSEPTLQRFTTLRDVNNAEHRLADSLNGHFVQLAEEYPFGNGLGGGGTSLPYFLRERTTNRVAMENEYARIMLEQGIPGLCLWLAFIVWLLMRPVGRRYEPFYLGRWLARLTCAAYFAAAAIGTGLLTSIPATPLMLLLGGWLAARQPAVANDALSARQRAVGSDYAMARPYGW